MTPPRAGQGHRLACAAAPLGRDFLVLFERDDKTDEVDLEPERQRRLPHAVGSGGSPRCQLDGTGQRQRLKSDTQALTGSALPRGGVDRDLGTTVGPGGNADLDLSDLTRTDVLDVCIPRLIASIATVRRSTAWMFSASRITSVRPSGQRAASASNFTHGATSELRLVAPARGASTNSSRAPSTVTRKRRSRPNKPTASPLAQASQTAMLTPYPKPPTHTRSTMTS